MNIRDILADNRITLDSTRESMIKVVILNAFDRAADGEDHLIVESIRSKLIDELNK